MTKNCHPQGLASWPCKRELRRGPLLRLLPSRPTTLLVSASGRAKLSIRPGGNTPELLGWPAGPVWRTHLAANASDLATFALSKTDAFLSQDVSLFIITYCVSLASLA